MSLENNKDASELRKIMSLINSKGTQECSPVFDTLKEEIGLLKEQINTLVNKPERTVSPELNELREIMSLINSKGTQENSPVFNTLKEEIGQLKEHITTLVNKPERTISPELNDSICKISKLPFEEICRIGENVAAFSSQVADMQRNVIESSRNNGSRVTSSPGAMQPNTVSPHLTNKNTEMCKPFSLYKDDTVTSGMKEGLYSFLESVGDSFKTIGTESARDVLFYGDYGYRYPGGEHKAQPIPEVIKELTELIKPHLPNPEATLNSCLISRYMTGENCIPPHRDAEAVIGPESDIVTVSIGAERTMSFASNNGNSIEQKVLKDGSVIVSSRFAQDFWVHSIDPCESADIRYSFTLRHIDPHFLNSTIIIGDFNTANIKFGSGIGNLGAWMPGKRVKVGHIDAIPEPDKIGPYRNFIIHTGINSINCSPRYRKSNRALIDGLETKVRSMRNVSQIQGIHQFTSPNKTGTPESPRA